MFPHSTITRITISTLLLQSCMHLFTWLDAYKRIYIMCFLWWNVWQSKLVLSMSKRLYRRMFKLNASLTRLLGLWCEMTQISLILIISLSYSDAFCFVIISQTTHINISTKFNYFLSYISSGKKNKAHLTNPALHSH